MKTSRGRPDGTFSFGLSAVRRSNSGSYSYIKDYAADSDVMAFVCLPRDGGFPVVYLLATSSVPTHLVIRPGGRRCREGSRDDWGRFRLPAGLELPPIGYEGIAIAREGQGHIVLACSLGSGPTVDGEPVDLSPLHQAVA